MIWNCSEKNEKQVDTLVYTLRDFSLDTGMQFGIKYAVLAMKKEKMSKCEAIKVPGSKWIRNLEEVDKYIGLFEADDVKDNEMKG